MISKLLTTAAGVIALAAQAQAGPVVELDVLVNGQAPAEIQVYIQDLDESGDQPPEVPQAVDPAGVDIPTTGRHRLIIYTATETTAPADGPIHPVAQAIRWLRIAAGTE